MFAAHGVVVSPHGAGLMNMLFMPRGSSVVEIYPYHLQHNLYPTLAAFMQIGHYGVYNFNNSDIVTREKVTHGIGFVSSWGRFI
jgi:capsular polysaccharide biosynthesis protein